MSMVTHINPSTHGKAHDKNTGEVLVNLSVVKKEIGFGSSFIYKEIAEGRFPRPVKIGAKASRWVLSEVRTWIDAHILDRDGVK